MDGWMGVIWRLCWCDYGGLHPCKPSVSYRTEVAVAWFSMSPKASEPWQQIVSIPGCGWKAERPKGPEMSPALPRLTTRSSAVPRHARRVSQVGLGVDLAFLDLFALPRSIGSWRWPLTLRVRLHNVAQRIQGPVSPGHSIMHTGNCSTSSLDVL